MATPFSITLPPDLKEKTEAQVTAGNFDDSSDYVQHLIREDVEAQAREDAEIEHELREAEKSPISDKSTEQIFAEIRANINRQQDNAEAVY